MNLIVGMEWSHLRWKASWQPLVALDDLLPRAGETVAVRLDPFFETPPDGPAAVLWRPPHSELNGWRDRPSEIVESRVVEGDLTRLEPLPHHPHGGTWSSYRLEIRRVRRLIDLFTDPGELARRVLPGSRPTSHRYYGSWEEAGKLTKAEIGPWMFIAGIAEETQLEAVLRVTEESVVVHQYVYMPPATWEAGVINERVTTRDEQTFRRVLATAEVIEEIDGPPPPPGTLRGAAWH